MRHSLLIAASIIIGCLLIGLLLGGSITGQVPAPLGLATERYKAKLIQMSPNEAKLVLYDTATGHCWTYTSGRGSGQWNDLGSPAADGQAK